MDVANITEVSATGDVTTETSHLYAVTLTSAAAATTLQVRSGGSGGTLILHLESPANASVAAPLNAAVACPGGIHATITGADGFASLVHS